MKLTAMLASMLLLAAGWATAGDSPQFRGPARDGKFDEEGLLKAWPEGGPAVAWIVKGIGAGYSSVSISQGRIFVSGRENETGSVSVFNLEGVIEKKIAYGPETLEKQAPGSRSTPTVDGNRLYLLSGLGTVCCLDWTTGKTVWAVDIVERLGGIRPTWHFAESLLIDGNRVICTPGGKDAGLAALDKRTGETVWTTKGFSDKASYCSPGIVTHNGRRILTTATSGNIVGVDPDTGALLWTFAQKAPWDIHAVTPLYQSGLIYYVAGDKTGGGALELSPDGAAVTSKWTDKNLDCLHHGVVLVDGYLYGCGYNDNAKLTCLEMATGKLMWQAKEIGEGVVIYADGMLYVYEGPKSGVVSLVKASPTGFERTGTFALKEGEGQHWAHPAIANGRLYLRHGDSLVAYKIAQ